MSTFQPPMPIEMFPNDTDSTQLARLGAILKGLDGGAAEMRRHTIAAITALQAGVYHVDALAVSRRIIEDAMRKHWNRPTLDLRQDQK